ncbi:MAG: hypothetical protein IPP40_06165 [bacterium]|nr:hypothetical protein [bacterium]
MVRPDVWIYKINSDGSSGWNQVYPTDGWEYINTIEQIDDGSFLLCGSIGNSVNGNPNFYVFKTDSAGNQRWAWDNGGNESDEATGVQVVGDSIFVTGHSLSYSDNSDLRFVMLESDLTFIRETTYGRSFNEYVRSPIQTDDGGFLVPRRATNKVAPPGGFIGSLTRTDSLGNVLWRRQYGARFPSSNADSDNRRRKAVLGYPRIQLIKVDSLGIQEWSARICHALRRIRPLHGTGC